MGEARQRTLVQCSQPTHLTLTSRELGLLARSSPVGTLRLSEVKELLKVALLVSGRAGIKAQGPGSGWRVTGTQWGVRPRRDLVEAARPLWSDL